MALPAALPTLSLIARAAAFAGAILCAAFLLNARAGTVQMLDGTFHDGAVSVDAGILIRGATTSKVALHATLISRFVDDSLPEDYMPGVVLTDGTRLAGRFSSLEEAELQLGSKRVPGAAVAWAVYQPFDARMAAEVPAGKTGALLPGGDFFEGVPKGGDAVKAKVLHAIFGPRSFGAPDLHALILRGVKSQPAAYAVTTRDGSRYLALDVVAKDTTGIMLRHPQFDGLQIAAADLVEIRAGPSRLLSLAAQPPSRVKGAYATKAKAGGPLRIGGRVVRGCALSGAGAASWRSTTRGGAFSARVAASPDGSPDAKVIFIFEADGRELFRSAPLGPKDPPQAARCPVPAAETLTLRTEGGGDGIWADPVILLR